VALRVRDTGEGIAEDDLPHIWERFYRSDHARALDGSAGSGLGLALVKEVIEAMGGAVAVASIPNEGCAFSLLLPVASGTPVTPDASVAPPNPRAIAEAGRTPLPAPTSSRLT
jgi:signal transduction histidine kinase